MKKDVIKENVSLKECNTMKINCVADYFVEATGKEDILSATDYAKKEKLPLIFIGKGSNVILPPRFKGVAVFLGMEHFSVEKKKSFVRLLAGAGAYLPDVSRKVTAAKGGGLEWAGGVPGSIGGAIRGNAGAFDDFTGDYIKRVKALSISQRKEVYFTKEECKFGYRESVFKRNRDYIVLEGEMEFPVDENAEEKFDRYLSYRKERHPEEPSAGSIFKNPEVDDSFFEKYREAEKFKKMGFVPASFLIDACELKGKTVGGAQISEKHSNFIINKKEATKENVVDLINLVKEKVKERFGVILEEEVEIVEV